MPVATFHFQIRGGPHIELPGQHFFSSITVDQVFHKMFHKTAPVFQGAGKTDIRPVLPVGKLLPGSKHTRHKSKFCVRFDMKFTQKIIDHINILPVVYRNFVRCLIVDKEIIGKYIAQSQVTDG